MPSENKTNNYSLNQWQGNEYLKREDLNTDNEIIDVELKNVNDKADSKISRSLATTANQLLLSSAVGQWAVKTIDEIKSLLGLGSAAYTNSNAYATAAQGTKADNAATQAVFNTHLSDYVRQPGYAITTGAANTYAATLNPAPILVDGTGIAVKIHAANTGASTLNVNGLGAKPIIDSKGNAIKAGKLLYGRIYSLKYDGTNFQLLGEGGEYGTAGAGQVLAGYTIGTESGLVSGTMVNRGAVTITPSNAEQAIPAGYHSGSGKVSAVTGTATPADVVNGKTFASAAGVNLIGTYTGKPWYQFTAVGTYPEPQGMVFQFADGGLMNGYGVEVTLNLSFTPKTLIMWQTDSPQAGHLWLFTTDEAFYFGGGESPTVLAPWTKNFAREGTYCYMKKTGIRFPVHSKDVSFTFLLIG